MLMVRFLLKNFFGDEITNLLNDLFENNVYPIVYSFINNVEKFSYVNDKCTDGMQKFLDTRKNDKRENIVYNEKELFDGDIFYITCIDEKEKLEPLYEKYKEQYHLVFQVDIYTQAQWLEIMPKTASKSNAIKQLKSKLGCDRLVVFGVARWLSENYKV